ncbi:MAG: type II toxin-antitoxin system Phd/YefM family antitoxin [Gemmatimonadaceae bacterium]
MIMRAVGVRELKNRLSEYLRAVRRGDQILVTDRGEIVAELRPPGLGQSPVPYPALLGLVHSGSARLGTPNVPQVYPRLPPRLPDGEVFRLLEEERGDR